MHAGGFQASEGGHTELRVPGGCRGPIPPWGLEAPERYCLRPWPDYFRPDCGRDPRLIAAGVALSTLPRELSCPVPVWGPRAGASPCLRALVWSSNLPSEVGMNSTRFIEEKGELLAAYTGKAAKGECGRGVKSAEPGSSPPGSSVSFTPASRGTLGKSLNSLHICFLCG